MRGLRFFPAPDHQKFRAGPADARPSNSSRRTFVTRNSRPDRRRRFGFLSRSRTTRLAHESRPRGSPLAFPISRLDRGRRPASPIAVSPSRHRGRAQAAAASRRPRRRVGLSALPPRPIQFHRRSLACNWRGTRHSPRPSQE